MSRYLCQHINTPSDPIDFWVERFVSGFSPRGNLSFHILFRASSLRGYLKRFPKSVLRVQEIS